MPTISFSASMVGLVVRGKRSPVHEPSVLDQHADCILPDGSPVGFFGDGPNRSGGRHAASSMQMGLNMRGVVYDYSALRAARPWYVNLADAKASGVVSTILTVEVGAALATKFGGYWRRLAGTPGGFDLLGNNCSTHASDAFVSSGVLKDGIPGLDTPNNLYKQLVRFLPGKTASYSGFVGFNKRLSGAGFDVVVE